MSYELLTPGMDITIESMEELSASWRGRICKCEPQCERYIHLDGYGRYCENAARVLALSIYSLVEGINRIEPNAHGRRNWTLKEEKFITDWYEKYGGVRYGDIRLIAGMLGRQYNSVREKIKQMQRDGIV